MSSIQFNRTDRVLANVARTASLNAPDQRNQLQRGVIVVFDITAVPTVDTVLLTIEGKDPVSGQYYTILAGTAQVEGDPVAEAELMAAFLDRKEED